MGKRILFSPVGMRDPVKKDYDGPMLHIVRHYRPDIVHLFLSKECTQFHRKRDLYGFFIRNVVPGCQIVAHETDITEVHDFDLFTERIYPILADIFNEYPDCELLANVSSGTPQMQAALCILIMRSPFPIKPIQVTTPEIASNMQPDIPDMQKALDNLIDDPTHGLNPKNRCRELKISSHRKAFLAERAEAFIGNCNYAAAQEMLRGWADLFSAPFLEALDAARRRAALFLRSPGKLPQYFQPVQNEPERSVLEYYMQMKIRFRQGEFADGVLRVSPLMIRALRLLLKKDFRFDITTVTKEDRYGEVKWEPAAFESRCPELLARLNALAGQQLSAVPLSLHMMKLLYEANLQVTPARTAEEARSTLELLGKVRTVEREVRNDAAHQIEPLDETIFLRKSGMRPDEFLLTVEKILSRLVNRRHFESVDNMNKYLINLLKAEH
jgi:CRISPR type III-A/MTUBE-associated protein Csm6